MTKKTKKVAKKAQKIEKVQKVEIIEPEVKEGTFSLKKEPEVVEPVLLPVEPTPEPVISPNEPKIEGIDNGYKRPSITNTKYAYTKKQYKALIEAYKKENPAKYELKKSELEKKLANIKE